jgi:hypothetical protein
VTADPAADQPARPRTLPGVRTPLRADGLQVSVTRGHERSCVIKGGVLAVFERHKKKQ